MGEVALLGLGESLGLGILVLLLGGLVGGLGLFLRLGLLQSAESFLHLGGGRREVRLGLLGLG